ncbi:hypothetical protein AAE478_010068 [Parahypoxylon ruwenzoriense]
MFPRYLTLFWATYAAAIAVWGPAVRDGSVTYIGTDTGGVESFLNIRFGQDTGGERRFRPPLPFSYPNGAIVNATESGAACPQTIGNPLPQFIGVYENVTDISEDCLTVRVTRPLRTSPSARLPVMVYIYGGGYAFGSIYDDIAYDPLSLVRQDALKRLPIIYVAINYRVGIFGFAASDPLRDEGSMNAGLLDQYLGLQWVRDHIGSFGGNPDDVTLFGQNVGWTNIQLQLTAYGGGAEPLFNQAILQSGPTIGGISLTAGITDNNTAQVVQTVNCTSSSRNGQEELSCLRSLPMSTLNTAALTYSYMFSSHGGIGTFRPTAPSTFIPDAPSALLKSGRFRKGVDIIIGWNENDGSLFIPQTLNGTEAFTETIAGLFPGLSQPNLQALSQIYPVSEFSDYPVDGIERNFFRASQAVRDAHFVCPSLRMVEAWSIYAPDSSVYVYSLNQTALRVGHAHVHRSFVGVDHYSDLPYTFDVISAAWSATADQSDYDIASHFSGSWASFATFGQPTVPHLSNQELADRNLTFPDWPPAGWNAQEGSNLRIMGGPRDGMVSSLETYDEDLRQRCGFWNSDAVLEESRA